jgi:hypothetical protein
MMLVKTGSANQKREGINVKISKEVSTQHGQELLLCGIDKFLSILRAVKLLRPRYGPTGQM